MVDAEFAFDTFEAGDPEPGGFLILFGFGFIFALEFRFVRFIVRFNSITMVGFVVENHDILHAHQIGN